MQAHVEVQQQTPAALSCGQCIINYFRHLIDTGVMVPCLHVGGYRLYADLHCDGLPVVSVDVMEVL